MKHMIKIILFFIFILTVLYFGIQQTNSHNFDIIQQYVPEDTREIISTSSENHNFTLKCFGEELVINENMIQPVRDIINSIISK